MASSFESKLINPNQTYLVHFEQELAKATAERDLSISKIWNIIDVQSNISEENKKKIENLISRVPPNSTKKFCYGYVDLLEKPPNNYELTKELFNMICKPKAAP